MVQQYLLALDSVLECHPELQGCIVGCADCGLRFLTHPRNAGREDLRCPFGCRAHHRRECSRQRSVAYYRTATGKQKKRHLNARRSEHPRSGAATSSEADSSPSTASASSPLSVELPEAGVVLEERALTKSRLLPYVRMVVNLLEGLQLALEELVPLLLRNLRQHRMGRWKKGDYVGEHLVPDPP